MHLRLEDEPQAAVGLDEWIESNRRATTAKRPAGPLRMFPDVEWEHVVLETAEGEA